MQHLETVTIHAQNQHAVHRHLFKISGLGKQQWRHAGTDTGELLSPHLHGEVRRLHLGAGGEVFEQELVTLLQPQVDTSQRLVVERTDPQQALLAVVNVQHLPDNGRQVSTYRTTPTLGLRDGDVNVRR